MASAISLEYLVSLEGVANGLATLDSSGVIPAAQLPADAVSPFKGTFADSSALPATGILADYAYVTDTGTFWYWNPGLATPGWANQNITLADYNALPEAAKAQMPYILVPTP